MPIVSIIIPVYNISGYLSRCIESCINQTFSDIEIIVVNDGSTDNSLEIIEKFAQTDRRISIINKENEGLMLARKSGIDIAKGEFVFHLDGDDYIEEITIEVLHNEVTKQKIDIAIGSFSTDTKNLAVPFFYPKEGIWNSEEYMSYIISNYSFSIWGKLIRKELYKNIEHMQINIGEDVFAILKIMTQQPKISIINKPLYHYVQRESSMTNNNNIQKRSAQELQCAIVISKLLHELISNETNKIRLTFIAANKICFFLCTNGHFGEKRQWIRDYLRTNFIQNKRNRDYLWKENKLIFMQLFISYYLSPRVSQSISIVRKKIK